MDEVQVLGEGYRRAGLQVNFKKKLIFFLSTGKINHFLFPYL
jgi:hypothetical protein